MHSHRNPRTNLTKLGRLLEQVHIVSQLSQPNRSEESTDTAADDGDGRFLLSRGGGHAWCLLDVDACWLSDHTMSYADAIYLQVEPNCA